MPASRTAPDIFLRVAREPGAEHPELYPKASSAKRTRARMCLHGTGLSFYWAKTEEFGHRGYQERQLCPKRHFSRGDWAKTEDFGHRGYQKRKFWPKRHLSRGDWAKTEDFGHRGYQKRKFCPNIGFEKQRQFIMMIRRSSRPQKCKNRPQQPAAAYPAKTMVHQTSKTRKQAAACIIKTGEGFSGSAVLPLPPHRGG